MSINRLKWTAILCFVVAMGGLLLGGLFANRQAPPYPGTVSGPNGATLFSKQDILAGQNVYQRYGLMDHGSVWGHGSLRGMDFSAFTLHCVAYLARQYSLTGGSPPEEAFRSLPPAPRSELDETDAAITRTNIKVV